MVCDYRKVQPVHDPNSQCPPLTQCDPY
jgi:hypothetical protein